MKSQFIIVFLLSVVLLINVYNLYNHESYTTDQSQQILGHVQHIKRSVQDFSIAMMQQFVKAFHAIRVDVASVGQIGRQMLAQTYQIVPLSDSTKFQIADKLGRKLTYRQLFLDSIHYTAQNPPTDIDSQIVEVLRGHLAQVRSATLPPRLPSPTVQSPSQLIPHHITNFMQDLKLMVADAEMPVPFHNLFEAVAEASVFTNEELGVFILLLYTHGTLIPAKNCERKE